MKYMNKSDTTDPFLTSECCKVDAHNCISWSAIISGALVSVGLSFLLNLFSVATGLSVFTVKDNTTSLAIGGFIAALVGVMFIMFVSGFISGYIARHHSKNKELGALYGFSSWVVGLIIMITLASGFTYFVASYYQSLFGPHYMQKTSTYPSNLFGITEKSMSNVVNNTAHSKTDNQSVKETISSTNNSTMAHVPKMIETISQSLFATFFLFFMGAISSAFGGYYGISCGCCSNTSHNNAYLDKNSQTNI